MANPACLPSTCVATDVIPATNTTCSSIKDLYKITHRSSFKHFHTLLKPFTSPTIVDSDNAQTYQWLVPFDECEVTSYYDTVAKYHKYDLFFNSNRKVFKLIKIISLVNQYEIQF